MPSGLRFYRWPMTIGCRGPEKCCPRVKRLRSGISCYTVGLKMLDFTQFECLTLDCYGTLIDWESGILGAIRPILEAHHRKLSDDGILELYAALESEEESGPNTRNIARSCSV